MAIIEDALSNLKSIKKMIPQWGKDAVIDGKDKIINLVKYDQLAIGINSFGSPLAFEDGRYGSGGDGTYAPSTQDYATAQGAIRSKPEGSPYNFQWTGDTFANMYLKSVNKAKGTFDISSKTAKKRLLESLYGEIFDLTDEHNDWINKNIIEPYMAKKIEERLFDF